MEIRYRCERCGKDVRARVSKRKFKSKGYHGKEHNRVDCLECGRYIKFIGERELKKLKIVHADEILDSIPIKLDVDEFEHKQLEEIGFKLDLILDHLGIIAK